ncbi:MAG: hypothetical protein WC307_05035 [Candidatus Nanoarchaeia archaeon]|jgi:polyhydroxyalkanoate synthesis regulator phasin
MNQISQLEKELIAMGESKEYLEELHKTYKAEYKESYERKYVSHLKEIMKKYYGNVE